MLPEQLFHIIIFAIISLISHHHFTYFTSLFHLFHIIIFAIISHQCPGSYVDLCENYRPISLLNLGYKVFAALVRKRLVEAGAEARLSETQFGFRSGCSAVDAIFILRRLIDQSMVAFS